MRVSSNFQLSFYSLRNCNWTSHCNLGSWKDLFYLRWSMIIMCMQGIIWHNWSGLFHQLHHHCFVINRRFIRARLSQYLRIRLWYQIGPRILAYSHIKTPLNLVEEVDTPENYLLDVVVHRFRYVLWTLEFNDGIKTFHRRTNGGQPLKTITTNGCRRKTIEPNGDGGFENHRNFAMEEKTGFNRFLVCLRVCKMA